MNDYLAQIQKDFAIAKLNALEHLNAKSSRLPSKLPKRHIGNNLTAWQQTDIDVPMSELMSFDKSRHFDIADTTKEIYANCPIPSAPVLVVDGEIKNVLTAKQTVGEICGIDWLNATMFDTTFDDSYTVQLTDKGLRHTAIVKNISKTLKRLLGFGISKQNKTGMHFYETSYQLEHNAGTVCLGGQRDSVLLMINGKGCDYAKPDWRGDLYTFLKTVAKNPKITRVDLAHDDLHGDYTDLAWFAREFDKGGFNNGGAMPAIELRGNWKYPDGKGRTLYVGRPGSPKYCRIYEKGKAEGASKSKWLRTEVEYKAKGMHIDLKVLINPSPFFMASYPCFKIFDIEQNFEQQRFERIEKEEELSFAVALGITKNQFGRYINCFRDEFIKHGLTDTDLLDVLTTIANKAYPEKLDRLSIQQYFKKPS